MRKNVHASRIWLRLLLIPTIAAVLAAPSSASAQLGSFHDPQDTSLRLDLNDVSLRFHPQTHRYTWRFTTFERFRLANGGTVVLFIDSVGAGSWDYRLYMWDDPGSSGVFCDGGIRPGAGGERRFRPTSWRVRPRSGWCNFKGVRMTKPIRWRVITVIHQGKPFGPPVDLAPDSGWF